MHGDRAVVRVVRVDRDGRREGALVEVVERGVGKVVGRLPARERGGVRPPPQLADPPRCPHPAGRGSRCARRRLRRRARHREPPTRRHPPIGAVEEVLGDRMLPGMEIDVAIRALGAAGGVARGGRAGSGGAAFRSGRGGRLPLRSGAPALVRRSGGRRRGADREGMTRSRKDAGPRSDRRRGCECAASGGCGLGRLWSRAAVRGRGSSATWPARCRRSSRHAERGSSGPWKQPAAVTESMEQVVTKAVPGH